MFAPDNHQFIFYFSETGTEEIIPVPNINAKTMTKVLEYCDYHTNQAPAMSEEEVKAWDTEFVTMEQSMLFELMVAANYLHIQSLLDLACLTVAKMITGKSPDEIREIFKIKNDFTPEQEEEIRRENGWAFE
jgi:S-phase kinase-associated protein 1